MAPENKVDKWKADIAAIAEREPGLPHCSNLLRKLELPGAITPGWQSAFDILIPKYIGLRKTIIDNDIETEIYKELVNKTNDYMATLRSDICNVFSHQSDFISSVVPELFLLIFRNISSVCCIDYEVTSQKDLIVECMFDSYEGGRMILKKKRVDVMVALPGELKFKGEVNSDFCIPIIAMEIKTNMDKNMISGIEHSVESLKRTFPNCLYFAISEYSDFAIENQNYSATYIDELFILRKQKRSEIRRGGAISNDIGIDLIESIVEQSKNHILETHGSVKSLVTRMDKGTLIKSKKL